MGLLDFVRCCHGEAQSRIHLFVLDGVTSGGANLDSPTSGWARGKWNENNNIKIPSFESIDKIGSIMEGEIYV